MQSLMSIFRPIPNPKSAALDVTEWVKVMFIKKNMKNIDIGSSKKKLNIMKKVNILCRSFQKVKPIYYIDSLDIEGNISSLCFLKFG